MRRSNKATKPVLIATIAVLVIAGAIASSVLYRQYRIKNAVCTNDCNILLISVDSLRADHLSAYGYGRNTSPNFDKLASKGTLFNNYYSSSFLTPTSEMSVQTGLYPTSNGVTNFDTTLPKSTSTLAEYMKKLGYDTQAIISSPEFVGNPALRSSFSRGFDKYETPNLTKPSAGLARGYPDINNITSALNDDNKQNFLWLAVGGVHWPFGYKDPDYYAVTNYNGVFAGKELDASLFLNVYKGIYYPSKAKVTNDDTQYVKDQYDNGVKAFDTYLGQIMQKLEELNLQKQTIIIIQSEHGEGLGEHGYFAHYDVMDNQVHTPLLIVDPRINGGKKVTSLVGSVDVLPTVLDLLGTSSVNGLQGKSLVGLMDGSEVDGNRKAAYIERIPLWEEAVILQSSSISNRKGILADATGAEDIAIRTDRWKYILRLSNKRQEEISMWKRLTGQPIVVPPAELYDLQNDPGETKNVLTDNPQIAAQLNKQLNKWYSEIQSKKPTEKSKPEIVQPYQ